MKVVLSLENSGPNINYNSQCPKLPQYLKNIDILIFLFNFSAWSYSREVIDYHGNRARSKSYKIFTCLIFISSLQLKQPMMRSYN